MSAFFYDLRYSLRKLRWSPGFTAVAVVSLALGIGVNTVIFSLVNAILLRPLPYKDPDRLAMAWLDNQRLNLKEDLTSWPNYEDWKKNQSFEDMAAFSTMRGVLSEGEPELVVGARVTANYFSVLGVRPMIGRVFAAAEEQPGQDRVVIVSHALWRERLGGDRNLEGKKLVFFNNPYQVVGVMPEGFTFPAKETRAWFPLALSPQAKQARGGFFLSVIGRIRPGVSLEQARAEMNGIARRLVEQFPDMKGYGVYVVPLLDQIVGTTRAALWIMLGAVVFVLLIACANLAGLSLARGASREREIAVRAAIGAGRGRLVRQLITESLLVSLIAGAMAVLLAMWGVYLFTRFAPADTPRLAEVAIDWRVLVFTLGISIAAGVLSGMAPAWKISRCDLQESLKESGSGSASGLRSRRLRTALVAGELAVAVMLLAGAGLLIRSFTGLRAVDPGFRAEQVLRMQVGFSRATFAQPAQVAAAWQQLIARLEGMRGVRSAGMITDIFLSITPNSGNFTIEGRPPLPPDQQIEATADSVTPGYFRAMGAPIRRGRTFTEQDGPDAPRVVVINETFAKWFWPNEDPVGKRFAFGDGGPNARWMTIVGVAADMRRQGLEKQARAETFMPITQRTTPFGNLVLRASTAEPLRLASAVRGEIRALDKSAVIYNVTTIQEMLAESLSKRRLETWLLGLFSALALALAAIGIYGLMSFSVAQRTHEIGIRIALGAERREVLRMVMRHGLGVAAMGAGVGLAGAFALTRFLTTMLYGVAPWDPVSFGSAAALLGAVALAACWTPALKATRVEPVKALRYE